jgi:hypothetical protein
MRRASKHSQVRRTRAYLMGGPDAGPRIDVMGQSDLRFVDALFSSA